MIIGKSVKKGTEDSKWLTLASPYYIPGTLLSSQKKFQKDGTSGQDGGVGRYALHPHTAKRRTTNNLKKKIQNCPKIKLYGSLTTKELKKKHSYRLVH